MTIVTVNSRRKAVTTHLLTVSGAAREIERRCNRAVRPRDISNLLYDRRIDDCLCPLIAGRRMIAPEVLPRIEELLVARGTIAKVEAKTNAS